MQARISKEMETIVGYAREEAMRTGCYSIGADHLMLAILRHGDNQAVRLLRGFGVDPGEMKRYIDSHLFHEHSVPYSDAEDVNLTRDAQNAINLSVAEAAKSEQEEVSSVHLLLALSRAGGSSAGEFLNSRGIDPDTIAAGLPKTGFVRSKDRKEPERKTISIIITATPGAKKTFS